MLTPANIRDTWVLVASVGGAGFLKPAPGTWGSAAGAALWWQLAEVSLITQVLCVFAAVALGLWATWRIALTYGVDDDQAIVIDELAGVWLTLLAAPQNGWVFLLGFGLFRLFDIWKPWPIRWVDRRLPTPWGVMLDDVVAGVFAAAVLNVSIWWLLPAAGLQLF